MVRDTEPSRAEPSRALSRARQRAGSPEPPEAAAPSGRGRRLLPFLLAPAGGRPAVRPPRAASSVGRCCLSVLPAALPAVVLCLLAAAPAAAQTTVWSATLTVASLTSPIHGCDDAHGDAATKCEPTTGALTDDDFIYDGTTYDITHIGLTDADLILRLRFSQSVSDALKGLVLLVDDRRFALKHASLSSCDNGTDNCLQWANGPGPAWTAGQTVSLSLKDPAALSRSLAFVPSTRTITVAEGGTATYTVALSSQPTAAVTVNLLMTDQEPGKEGDVSVTPETLSFTIGSSGTWSTPQTVTVAAMEDANSDDERPLIVHQTVSTDPYYDKLFPGVRVTVDDNELSSDAALSGLMLSAGALTPPFAPATTFYTASVAESVTSVTVTPTVRNSGATVTVDGAAATSGQAGAPITLATLPKTISVVVTAENGVTRTYRVSVTRVGAPTTPTTLTLAANRAPAEGGPDVTVTARLNAAAPQNGTTVTLSTTGSTAGSGDYTLSPTTLTIAEGQTQGTATLRVIDDSANDHNERIVLNAVSTNPVLTSNTLTLTIADNDGAPPPDEGGGGGFGGGFGGGGGDSRTTAPDSPQNLTATAADGQVVLSWDAPQDDGGSPITDYEFRNVGRDPWTSTASTDTTHTVTDLVNGTTYVFEVRAVNRNGKSFASNRAEAVPTTPEVFALHFAHFAAGDGAASELVLVNAAPRPVRPAVHFHDTRGEPIAPESLVDLTDALEIDEDGALTVSTPIEPLGDLTIAARGGEELRSGSVQVLSTGPLGGFVRYSVPGVGVTGVSAGAPVRDILFPARRQQGGLRTAVALHNLEDEAVELTCRLLRAGAVLEEAAVPLAANGQASWFIEDTFAAAAASGFAGTVRCAAPLDRKFTAIAVETDAARRIFTTLPPAQVDRTGGGGGNGQTTLDFAHFANGGGAVSELVFVNRSPLASRPAPTPFHQDIPASRPVVYFYDTQGEPIAPESVVDVTGDLEVREDGALTVSTAMEPLAALTISTHGRGELLTGSLKVLSAGPIGGFVRFDISEVGVAAARAGAPVRDALWPVRRQAGGITTGIALHNLESSPGLVRCELLRQGVLLDAASFPLAANGQTSWLLDKAFPAAGASDFTGSLRCTAAGEGRFTAVALETDPARRAFLTLPVTTVPEKP